MSSLVFDPSTAGSFSLDSGSESSFRSIAALQNNQNFNIIDSEDSSEPFLTPSSSYEDVMNITPSAAGSGDISEVIVKRKRGRPPKKDKQASMLPPTEISIPLMSAALNSSSSSPSASPTQAGVEIKRKRGRPPKKKNLFPGSANMMITPSSSSEFSGSESDDSSSGSLFDDFSSLPGSPSLLSRSSSPLTIGGSGVGNVVAGNGTPVKRGRGRPRKYPLPLSRVTSSEQLLSMDLSSPLDLLPSFEMSSSESFDCRLPTDFQIVNTIKDLIHKNLGDSMDTESIRNALEVHFGVSLASRRSYISEVCDILCF